MGSVKNTIDKFGRQGKTTNTVVLKGPAGVGFKLTINGNYDINKKKLENVGEPENASDCATRNYVDNILVNIVDKMSQLCNDICDKKLKRVHERLSTHQHWLDALEVRSQATIKNLNQVLNK